MGRKKKEGTPRQSEGTGNSKRQTPLLILAVTLLVLAAVLNLRHLRPAPRLEPVPRPEQTLTSHQFPSSAARTPRTPSPLFTALTPETTGIDFVHPIDEDHPLSFLYFSGMASGGLAVGDIDGDQRPDIYIVGGPGKNRLYRQVDDFRFEDITQRAGVDGGDAWGCGATMADVNNDGRLDIYVCNYADPRNESVPLSPNLLYINRGDGTFSEESRAYGLNLSDASLEAVFADYDIDGDLDMYLLTYRYENPRGRPKEPPIVIKDGKRSIHPDFAIYYKLTDDEFLYDPAGRADGLMRNNGDGTFTNVSDEAGIFGAEQGLSATWWDYDDDGLPDLFVGNDFMGSDRLYHNNGDGKFSDVIRTAVPHTSWFSMGSDVADLNGDGRLDLLTADMASTTHFKQKDDHGIDE